MSGGLTRRTIAASAVLALLVGAAFAILLRAISEERDAGRRATHSQEVLAAAASLERLVLDLETGERGFLITRDESFLRPWRRARAAIPATSGTLIGLAATDPTQERRARRIVDSVQSYVQDHSVPLVTSARRGDPEARAAALIERGKARVDALRGQFDDLIAAERRLFAARQERADDDAARAIVLAAVGLAGSVALIVLFAGYITRAIVLPVRRASAMAHRLAGGDLSTRMSEEGVGEIGTLERSFNTMAQSLETSRDELTASRTRVVKTADETRRRIERDLHDGAQQRLTHTVITLKLARRALGDEGGRATELVDEALEHAEQATAELRELAHGILPVTLSRGGLRAGVETLVARVRLPVSVDVTEERLAPSLEAAAYFIVAEALTNVVKHAHARSAQVTAVVDGDQLHVEVRDDGVGGARVDGSSGLLGLQDRAAAMNGELRIESPPGAGTVVTARLPVSPG